VKPVDYDPAMARKVWGLRRAGVQFDVIAEQLHITPTAAKALFDKLLNTWEPGVSRALEADRLDRLHAAIWSEAAGGDLGAIDRVLKISERRDQVLAEPRENTHALATAYETALATSEHVTDVDQALIETGRTIANRVDEAVATGVGQEVTRALYLHAHLTNVLRELMATPAARINAGLVAPPVKEGKLAQLRAIQAGKGRTA
jgi:hypothetical protein